MEDANVNPTSCIINEIDSRRPHAVMVSLPMVGHIYPLLQFAKALVAHHGFSVTFVNNHYYHQHILAQESHSMESSHGKLRFEWIENGLPSDFDYGNIWVRRAEYIQGCQNMQATFKALLESLNEKSPPVSCVVFGSFFHWAHTAAVELNIPRVFFWTQSAAVFSIYYHTPLLVANGFFPYKKFPPECEEEEVDLVSYIPGVPPLHPAHFPGFLHVEDTNHHKFKTIGRQFDLLEQCSAVVIHSFHELEKEECAALQAEPLRVFLVGPLLPLREEGGQNEMENNSAVEASLVQEQRNECLRWLDKQSKQSVLYIAFGTLSNPPVEDLEAIALGLKESKQPFMWVLRVTSSYDATSDTLISYNSISEILPHYFLEETKEYGLIVPWAPQQQVLAHPSVGAFLTHCGWNSTLEGVSMGVPMIPLPRVSDQLTNCKYVVDIWMVVMKLKGNKNGKIDCAEVVRVLRVVFHEEEGQEIRRRASKLKEAARRAVEANSGLSIIVDMHKFSQAMSFPKDPSNLFCEHQHQSSSPGDTL